VIRLGLSWARPKLFRGTKREEVHMRMRYIHTRYVDTYPCRFKHIPDTGGDLLNRGHNRGIIFVA